MRWCRSIPLSRRFVGMAPVGRPGGRASGADQAGRRRREGMKGGAVGVAGSLQAPRADGGARDHDEQHGTGVGEPAAAPLGL